MSQVTDLRLVHEQAAMDGIITFDGELVEAFGFNEVFSVRMPVRLLSKVTVSFKSGLMAQPAITFKGRNGGIGYVRPIEVPDEQRAEIEAFCALVNGAIEKSA